MPDGTVSVLAEGDKEIIEELIEQLKVGPGAASVSDVDVDWQDYTGKYYTFDIRH
jgi:acylphosphatase